MEYWNPYLLKVAEFSAYVRSSSEIVGFGEFEGRSSLKLIFLLNVDAILLWPFTILVFSRKALLGSGDLMKSFVEVSLGLD